MHTAKATGRVRSLIDVAKDSTGGATRAAAAPRGAGTSARESEKTLSSNISEKALGELNIKPASNKLRKQLQRPLHTEATSETAKGSCEPATNLVKRKH